MSSKIHFDQNINKAIWHMSNHLTLILCKESDVKLKIIPLFSPVTILMLFLICGSLMYPQKTKLYKRYTRWVVALLCITLPFPPTQPSGITNFIALCLSFVFLSEKISMCIATSSLFSSATLRGSVLCLPLLGFAFPYNNICSKVFCNRRTEFLFISLVAAW